MGLRPGDRILLLWDGENVIYPLRGSILEAAASVKTFTTTRPLNFRVIRKKVRRRIAKRAVTRGS